MDKLWVHGCLHVQLVNFISVQTVVLSLCPACSWPDFRAFVASAADLHCPSTLSSVYRWCDGQALSSWLLACSVSEFYLCADGDLNLCSANSWPDFLAVVASAADLHCPCIPSSVYRWCDGQALSSWLLAVVLSLCPTCSWPDFLAFVASAADLHCPFIPSSVYRWCDGQALSSWLLAYTFSEFFYNKSINIYGVFRLWPLVLGSSE